jgi:hypothetical protein
MNCRESRPLLPLFLDGELEALHSTRCTNCEGEIRRMERLQELISASVAARVEEIDLGEVWEGVAARIAPVSRSWSGRLQQRLSEWRDEFPLMTRAWVPLSAAAAVAVLAALLWQPHAKAPEQVAAAVDNSAVVDSVQSNGVNSVAFLREPETNTMVLWITDNGPAPFEDSGDGP